MSSKVLTCCQARWAEFLSEFHFTITYRPGRLATLPDCLSRWDNVYPERGVDFISKNPQNFHQVIKKNGIQESRLFSIKVEIFSDLVDVIQKEVWKDKDYKEILKQLARGESVTDYSLEPQAKLLLFKDRVVILSNEEIQLNILQKCHDSLLAGHPGQENTLKLVKRDFYWAGMNQSIKEYVSSCQQCSGNKNIHHKKFGLLQPLQLPSGPWNSLTMEFITQLPLSNSFDSILLVVDRFSKMAIFIPTYGKITSLQSAQIFISHVSSKHGLPVRIVSDRGSLFLSSFWTNLWKELKISRDPSTAIHPETYGQTESVNQILYQYLWIYVWLASKNIKTTIPTNKLSERWLGPFEVIKKIGSHAYHLKLPQQWSSVHLVFHVSLLEPVKKSSITNCHQFPPPLILVEEQEEWGVAQALDSKLKRGKLWYLVEWKGFSEDPKRTTWEPTSNFTNSPDLVKDFHSLYPDKPGPNTSRV
ncbi:hypothetical protein O181_098603 [Austropuccinia psidii MF-1]|uniref:Integrase catalytic domain-containing protein n=1 Tax=Austropuccinia psidii MF-1 TaxID=1389203 RepID=A0A9Q3PEB7_9BASI|nr:hypothetical protein [Austropuccinia psidii MF-1]